MSCQYGNKLGGIVFPVRKEKSNGCNVTPDEAKKALESVAKKI